VSDGRLGALPARELPGGLVVHEAHGVRQRGRGLARLDALPAGHALHLTPCRSVHTLGMRFALDLVWLDRDGGVARVDADVAPRRLRTCLRARSVVECNAGEGPAFAAALMA
jgi:uncharacterized membrane protein (UPF0127 family)